MKGIVYIGHGSRVEEGNEQLRAFVKKAIERKRDIPIQTIGFIELAEPSIEEAIDECVAMGATDIAIVPVLLLAAGHAKVDIPQEIERAEKKYPEVSFSYGRPFGVETVIVDVLKQRLEAVGLKHVNGLPAYDDREEATILLVGRGSSDPDANSDLVKISRLLWEHVPVMEVEVCFLAATRPSLDEGLEKVIRLAGKKVYLLPYLLFSGVLMNSLQAKVNELNETLLNKEFLLCHYLGFDDQLVNILVERVDEVLEHKISGNPDLYHDRLSKQANGVEGL
ncbi:sirohydrochlorin chelatase [Halalkalibacterium halodurans]|uniref:BH1496 protein n=1 Tax=Halalkalibacterium halodurans (strain ATCC BAA-125 / DSM 18197 / FERM 7344 / JCM 9153 / C-125) TaxID=272558 RepID=Q9KCS3_HALH5|nr:sirohydrochlorin chelatase [Halalkalibacterium halodurans]MED4173308.1 sirohydrochlorin chelatase [Halalkalibacterium halodurans]BAB05215.1 BH1496 [Halalkalibacterium halodurans C-125]